MNKKTITKFLQSFVAIPMLAVTTPMLGATALPSPTVVLSQNTPIAETSTITTQEAEARKKHIEAIDTFLTARGSVLAGYGAKFVAEAEDNDIDWRLLVSIAGRETTFGRNMCKNPKAPNNPFGYGSCKIGFKSIDDAIEKVSASLGGNDEKTAHHYNGKTTVQILRKYNSVIPNYPSEVVRLMKLVDSKEEIL